MLLVAVKPNASPAPVFAAAAPAKPVDDDEDDDEDDVAGSSAAADAAAGMTFGGANEKELGGFPCDVAVVVDEILAGDAAADATALNASSLPGTMVMKGLREGLSAANGLERGVFGDGISTVNPSVVFRLGTDFVPPLAVAQKGLSDNFAPVRKPVPPPADDIAEANGFTFAYASKPPPSSGAVAETGLAAGAESLSSVVVVVAI